MAVQTATILAAILLGAVLLTIFLFDRLYAKKYGYGHRLFAVEGDDRKIHLYLDMDGCLAKWQDVSLETLYEKDYFRNLPPDEKLLRVMEMVAETFRGSVTEKICSHYLDGTDADIQKHEWLREFAQFIRDEDIVFVPYTKDKDSYIQNDGSVINVLIDDYSVNLHKWEKAGNVAIKYMNGINGTKGTWHGLKLDGTMDEESMYLQLSGMLMAIKKGGALKCAS